MIYDRTRDECRFFLYAMKFSRFLFKGSNTLSSICNYHLAMTLQIYEMFSTFVEYCNTNLLLNSHKINIDLNFYLDSLY